MPVFVQDLLKGRSSPSVVLPTQPLGDAIDTMMENDYSQLPVVDEAQLALGMVTTTSALDAVRHLGLPPDGLRVINGIVRNVAKVRPDDELVDLLVRLKTDSAVLVVDARDRVSGIITSFDAMEFFRGWAEERMLVEDIETSLKECVLLAFKGESDPMLEEAIRSVTHRKDAEVGFRRALSAFLNARGERATPGEAQVRAAYEAGFVTDKCPAFEDLDLSDFIQLLLAKERWSFYAPVVAPEPATIRPLLDEVRKTRNRLAHLRGEITSEECGRLKYCNDWLAVALSLLRKRVTASSPAPADRIAQVPGDEEAPLEEEGENSRYAPLASWLQRVRPEVNDLAVDFEQVEKLLGSQLPPSARKHAAWWANDAATHVQSRAWLNSGWRVESVDLGEEVVQFGRLRDRAEAYRVFFGDLAARLARLDSPLRSPEPRGRNWMDIVSLPPGKSLGRVAFAFTRRRSARVELYIDCGDRARNKALFELLHGDAEALASECGEARLSWEKLDDARASRVAAYRPIFITDREKLPELLSWAEQTVPRFVEAFSRRLASAAKAV